MYEGSCLCQKVRIKIAGPISSIVHCHCSLCRKSSGTAYATNGFVATADLQLIAEPDTLAMFESTPNKRRFFCRYCGSPVYSDNLADKGRVRIRLGIIDSEVTERPVSHNFVSSRACWDDLDANLPRSDSYEPGRN